MSQAHRRSMLAPLGLLAVVLGLTSWVAPAFSAGVRAARMAAWRPSSAAFAGSDVGFDKGRALKAVAAGEVQLQQAGPGEEDEPFIKPALWNTPVFRAVALVAGGGVAGQVLPFAALMHISAFGIWFGTNVWTTFFAGITMFKNLPKQTFGKLQAKLFPQYFQLGTGCTAVVLLTGLRLGLPAGPAAASLAWTLANHLYLSPKATEVMLERYARQNKGLKDPEVDKKLGAQFGKLHGLSSLANLLALVGLVAHAAALAARI
mmetsp:Transcript_69189/g.224419  ORF Transcript_69189/g.224419 Transcript_69189/m.224419 type:complete len:261 (-) Transcript_69189:16-798(-)